MSNEAVEKSLSLLAFLGLAGVVLTWLGALLQRLGVGQLGSRIAGAVDGAEIGLAWVVAATATAGSLWFSEVANYIPCVLCWYQRIAMYPLVIVLLVAILRRERTIAPYALFLALAGLVVSIYHYQLEWFPDQSSICSTTASVPCHVKWFEHFGFVTIPFLAGSAFLMVITLMAIAWRNERLAQREAVAEDEPPPAEEDEPGHGPGAGTIGLTVGLVALVALAGVAAALALRGEDDEGSATTTPTPILRPGDPAAGARTFASAGCGGCHAFRPAGSDGSTGPALDGTALADDELLEIIAFGNGSMPAYERDLSQQQIADVAAFIRSG
jgi:disulfide bond formation protein DsbB/mono/diheme cytochrome c family protein